MKCIIIYFSQTGNTELVAKAIKAGVKQTAGHCDIATLKEANPRRLYEYDLIGLGCPVQGPGEPPNVTAFIKDMRFVGGKHVLPFSTHGTRPDPFFPSIVPKLKQRGLVVIGMYDCYGDCYMDVAPRPYPTGGHPDEIDLKEAENFGKEMVKRSRRIYAGETKLIPPVPKPTELSSPESREEMAALEKERGVVSVRASTKSPIKFDKEKCIYPKCRLCMDNCPMDGIDLSIQPPVVAKPCMRCSFCTKICPTGAIYRDDSLLESLALRFKMMLPEFYLAPLAKAEAEGRFRRLIPLEEIGLDTPVYKLHNKHPQWVIGKGLQ